MLHPYATETKERARIYWALAIISLLVSWLIQCALEALRVDIPWNLEIPTTPLGLYWILVHWFDTRVWKAPILRKLGIVTIPNIEGKWRVQGVSCPDKEPIEWTGSVTITQTWTGLLIVQETDQSISYSTAAVLGPSDGRGTKLIHQYRNEPKIQGAVQGMNIHYGTAILTIHEGGNKISGEYYSGRGRERYGYFTYTRE